MAKKKPTPKTAARKSGCPPPGERKIVPDDYDQIMRLYGQGWSFRQIAAHYDVGKFTIQHHFNKHIFPMIQASSTRSIAAELLKINELERVAWKCFYSTKPAERRELVKQQIAKLKTLPEAQRKNVESLLERAVTSVYRHGEKAWLEIAQWCIDTRCRLEGHFAAVKFRVQHEEYRVAGTTPALLMQDMMKRIHSKAIERREYETRVSEASGAFSRMTTPGKN